MEKRFHGRGDVQIPRSDLAVKNYCLDTTKRAPDTSAIELGEISYAGKRNDLKRAYEDIVSGMPAIEYKRKHLATYARYRHLYPGIKEDIIPPKRPREVHLYYGDTGLGKTHDAYSDYPGIYAVPFAQTRTWYQGYYGQDVALMDDFGGEMTVREFKLVTHDFPQYFEVKHSGTWWNPLLIVITSNSLPDQWWNFGDRIYDRRAIFRRITKVVHYHARGVKTVYEGDALAEFWNAHPGSPTIPMHYEHGLKTPRGAV